MQRRRRFGQTKTGEVHNPLDESGGSGDDDDYPNPLEEQDCPMPPRESPKLNLDALIIRQDMAVGKNHDTPDDLVFSHHELVSKGGATYAVLRKPDFQRSTS